MANKTSSSQKKNNFKNILSWAKDWLPIIFSFIGIVIFIHNCNKKNNIQDGLEYSETIQTLYEFQPKIKTIGKPICDSVVFVLDTLELTSKIKNLDKNKLKVEEKIIDENRHTLIKGFTIPYEPYIAYKIKFANHGTSNAEIIYSAMFDDLNGNFIIKEHLASMKNFSNDSSNTLPINRVIEVGDTSTIEFAHPILNLKSNKFQLHILLYYLNRLDNLYETYIWIEGELQEIPITFNREDKKHLLPLKKKYPCSVIYFQKPRDIIHYYLPNERDSILSIIRNMSH